MHLPQFILPALLRLHERAQACPYFHIDKPAGRYMDRYWVLGDRSPARNAVNKQWHGSAGGRLYCWFTEHVAVRAHTIYLSDSDPHPHDHPSWSVSVVLEGGYWEVLEPSEYARQLPLAYQRLVADLSRIDRRVVADYAHLFNVHWRGPGAVVFRSASTFHRLILPAGTQTKSLFVLGKKREEDWGFKTPAGKVGWREYLNKREA